MRVAYKVNDRATLDVEVKDLKQAFEFLSYSDSIFGVKRCGNCESENLRFDHRTPKGFSYYSIRCNDCHHQLDISQQKPENGGKLYPAGWVKPYQRDDSGGQDEQDEERETVSAGKGRTQRDSDIDF